MDRYDKVIYNRAIDDVVWLINHMEKEYRHEMCENDCMQDDPFSDGIMSAVHAIRKSIIKIKED